MAPMLTPAEAVDKMRLALGSLSDDNAVTTTDGANGRILVSSEPIAPRGARRPKPAETLFAVSEAVGSRLGLAEALRHTTRELARALGADVASVWRLQPSERQVSALASYRVPKSTEPALSSPAAFTQLLSPAVRRSGAPVYSSNSALDRRFDHPFLNLVPHRSVLIQPFKVNGQIAGVFVFAWTRARHRFTNVELRLVDAAAKQTGIAIENAELLVQSQQFNEQLERRVKDRTSRLKSAYEQLRRSKEELRALSAHMERVREDERARISREIHDDLGQALTALKMGLPKAASGNGNGNGHVDPAVLAAMIDDMMVSVRRIASELRPQILDDLGLLEALEWQAQEFERRAGVKCRFRCKGTVRDIDTERSTALFRIFQEILTNVARHADASRVQIVLAIGRTTLRLDVHDNGRGMSKPTSRAHQRLGILGMGERAAALGGRVVIWSAPNRGTQVRVVIPCPRPAHSG